MSPRYPSLLDPPLGFAHRGARAEAPENTLEAFRRALDLGAPGLESDVWLCADGEAVLHHEPVVRSGIRRRPLSELPRSRLPPSIPSLGELYDACGTAFELSLDVGDDAAASVVVAVAREAGGEAPARLWLCSSQWERAASWRTLSPDAHVVDSTRLRRIPEGPERRASALATAGVDAVNLPERDWTAGLTTLFHRFGRLAFAWGAQHRRQLDALLGMGVDAVYSDHVDRMVEALGGQPDSTPQD
ncbi:MAG: glycerophosphodiester phosphodiesterase [Actinomycetota bacterium]|nr:glycerophosphodiester phosphodiesterase [Actinomycetota bacterium]